MLLVTKDFKIYSGFFVLALSALLLVGCEGQDAFSLYDEDYESNPQPVINEVDPPENYLAGIDAITILGENFHPDAELNRVFFTDGEDTERGKVLSASEDVLEVRTGDLVSDDVIIRVEVRGAEKFSEPYEYELQPAVIRPDGIRSTHEPQSVEIDQQGNIYMALVEGGSNVGIVRIDHETAEMETIAERGGWTYQTIRMGPDNALYMVRPGDIPIIYRLDVNEDEEENWVFGTPRTDDIDFDQNGYLWGGGMNEGEGDDAVLVRVDQQGDYETFPFDADVTALRAYDGGLYAAGSQNDQLKVWRFDLDSNSEPGNPEEYFDFSGEVGVNDWTLHSMIFSDSGELFIGTDGDKAIIEVEPGGTEWQHFYPDVVDPNTLSLSWMPGSEYLFMAQGESNVSDGDLLQINMLRDGAPQYGRD